MAVNNENCISKLREMISKQKSLVNFTGGFRENHRKFLNTAFSFSESDNKQEWIDWHSNAIFIKSLCFTISTLQQELHEYIKTLNDEDTYKKIYERKNLSNQFSLWKIYADNTIKVVSLWEDIEKPRPPQETIDSYRELIAKFHDYFILITAQLPNSGNAFIIDTQLYLQQHAFHTYVPFSTKYIKLLNDNYMTARNEGRYTDAYQILDEMQTHVSRLLKVCKRCDDKNETGIADIEKMARHIQGERTNLSYLEKNLKNLKKMTTEDVANKLSDLKVKDERKP